MNWFIISGIILLLSIIIGAVLFRTGNMEFPPDNQKDGHVIVFVILLFSFLGSGVVFFNKIHTYWSKKRAFKKSWPWLYS